MSDQNPSPDWDGDPTTGAPADDTELRTLVEIPDGCILLGAVEVVSYIDEDGDTCYGFRWPASMSYSNVLGLLELVKGQVLSHYFASCDDD